MQLHEIREAKAAKVSEARSLLASTPTLTPEGQTKFDALKAEIVNLEGQEGRASFVEDMERRSLVAPVDKSYNSLENSVSIMEVIRAQMEGRALSGAAAEYQTETERRTGRKAEGAFVPMAALEKRVSTTGSAAQIATNDNRPDQYIDAMRNSLLARRLGVRVLSGLQGSLTIPKYGTGTTVGWVAENTALSSSDMTFSSVALTPKHAGGMTELSRQLIQQSSPDIEQLVRDDLSFMLAQAIDSALIIGGGTNQPVGILSTAGIQTSSLATLSWAGIVAMLQKLELVNATPNAWLMGVNPKAKLMSMVDSTGLPANFLNNGQMTNIPAYSTNQLVDKIGAPNKGRVLLGDFSQVLLGIWSELDVLVNPYDSVAYARGGVMVRAMSTVGLAVRNPAAFVLADDVTI